MKSNYLKCIGLLLLLSQSSLFSQVSSSPYSLFGSGQIMDKGFGISDAMGGTGIAFQSKNALNNLNPASYAGLDSLSFLFEVGMYGKFSRFETSQQINHTFDGNIRYLAIGFRVTHWWAISLGCAPVSSVGYNISTTDNIEGELTPYTKKYTGTGGINQFYISNAFNLGKYIALGFNTSYIKGSVTQTETIESVSDLSGYFLKKTNYVNSIIFDYGIQFKKEIGNLNYSTGLTFGNQKKLNTRSEKYLGFDEDTISIVTENTNYLIPKRYGIGIAVSKATKFCAGIDYSKENWSAAAFDNPYLVTRNSQKISFGVDYCPRTETRNYGFSNLNYQLGAYYKSSYLVIDNIPTNIAALTFGLGIPLRKQFTRINISAEIGQTGSLKHGLIKENYYLLNLNFSLHDKWFIKPKYD
jgi:hypothetical protein